MSNVALILAFLGLGFFALAFPLVWKGKLRRATVLMVVGSILMVGSLAVHNG